LVRSLNIPQFARIPFEEARECHLSMNQSRPLVLDPPCAVSNAIAKAAIGIYPAVETMWASRGGNAKAKRLGLGLKFGLKRA
jgi:hypothetical protein